MADAPLAPRPAARARRRGGGPAPLRATPRARRATARSRPPGGCSAVSHSRNRRSNCARPRCSSCSRSNRACTASRAAVQRARRASSAPAASACQRRSMSTIALTIGPGFSASASSSARIASADSAWPARSVMRIEPLPREPRDAAILVLRRVRELAQALGRVHPLGRVEARFRDLGREREVDQQALVADERERGAAPSASAVRRATSARIASGTSRPRATPRRPLRPPTRPAPCRATRRAPRERRARFPSRRRPASAASSVQRCAAAMRTSGAGSAARSCASSPESAGSAATPCTRCAGSACSCSAERENIRVIISVPARPPVGH